MKVQIKMVLWFILFGTLVLSGCSGNSAVAQAAMVVHQQNVAFDAGEHAYVVFEGSILVSEAPAAIGWFAIPEGYDNRIVADWGYVYQSDGRVYPNFHNEGESNVGITLKLEDGVTTIFSTREILGSPGYIENIFINGFCMTEDIGGAEVCFNLNTMQMAYPQD